MLFVGVVEQWKLKRVTRAVSRVEQQLFGLRFTFGLTQLLPIIDYGLVTVRDIGSHTVSGYFTGIEYLFANHVAVDCQ